MADGVASLVLSRLARGRRANVLRAALAPLRTLADATALREWSARLAELAPPRDGGARAVHLAWGFCAVSDAPRRFSLVDLMVARAASAHHPGARLVFHAGATPDGPYWEALAPNVTVLPPPAAKRWSGADWPRGEAAALLVRLLALAATGGVSPAADAVILRPCDDLGADGFTFATQLSAGGASGGISTHLLVAAAGDRFARDFAAAFAAVRSGDPAFSAEAVARMAPYALYAVAPQFVRILPAAVCATPAWTQARRFWLSPSRRDVARELLDGARVAPLHRAAIGEDLEAFERLLDGPPCALSDLVNRYVDVDLRRGAHRAMLRAGA